MSDKQHRSACALIRNLCSNYDRSTGGCLLLDRGEIVQCPQMITQSLVCRFFRDVLLEDRDGRALKAEIMGDVNPEVVARMAKNGILPGAKQGQAWIFRRDDLEKYINSLFEGVKSVEQ